MEMDDKERRWWYNMQNRKCMRTASGLEGATRHAAQKRGCRGFVINKRKKNPRSRDLKAYTNLERKRESKTVE
jgi:hypothetical protein